jgi:hypothetical protein
VAGGVDPGETGHTSDETILPDDETISGLPRKKAETVAVYRPLQ